jgi:hypothetical protein
MGIQAATVASPRQGGCTRRRSALCNSRPLNSRVADGRSQGRATRFPGGDLGIASAAQTVYAIVVGVSSGALGCSHARAWASVTAIGAQAAALAPFLITIGAAAAAIGGLVAISSSRN